jgi:hypothetical protein
MSDSSPRYKRILLKLSGEALMGDDAYGINRQTISAIVAEIKAVVDLGVRSAWSSAVATSFAVLRRPPPAWIAPQATTWACWRR